MPLAFGDSATSGAPLHFCAHLSPERPHLQKDRLSSAPLRRWRGRDRPQEGFPGSLESVAILGRPKKTQTCFLHSSGQPLPDLPNDAVRKPAGFLSSQQAVGRAAGPEAKARAVPTLRAREGREVWQEPRSSRPRLFLPRPVLHPQQGEASGSRRGSARPTPPAAVSSLAQRRKRSGKGGGNPAPEAAGSPA